MLSLSSHTCGAGMMVRSPAKLSKNKADGGSGLLTRICKDGECLFGLVDLTSSMPDTYHCLRHRRVHP